MPTYDYECPKCGYEFEEFQGINDDPIRVCPECRSRRVKRKIGTGAGIIFKGSGFYETDYRSDGYKKAAKAEKGQAEKSNADKRKPEKNKPESKNNSKTKEPSAAKKKKD